MKKGWFAAIMSGDFTFFPGDQPGEIVVPKGMTLGPTTLTHRPGLLEELFPYGIIPNGVTLTLLANGDFIVEGLTPATVGADGRAPAELTGLAKKFWEQQHSKHAVQLTQDEVEAALLAAVQVKLGRDVELVDRIQFDVDIDLEYLDGKVGGCTVSVRG